jgi:MFS family permease
MMCADLLADVMLIHTALKSSIQPSSVFICLLGCQIISSPIQGVFSDFFSQKKSLLFASLIGTLCIFLSSQISQEKGSAKDIPSILASSISAINLTIIFLCTKGLFGNITVIARAAIAEVIKMETLEKAKNV